MMNENELKGVIGGTEETMGKTPEYCDHSDPYKKTCCLCGAKMTAEGEKTRCLKFRASKGGDDKYHYFCMKCISEHGLGSL